MSAGAVGKVPVTIFTGYLGVGKTTIILNALKQLPAGYRVCWVKNEFGDIAVDSLLANQAAVAGVKEILNGCVCCTLVGQLGDALNELLDSQHPDRLIVETSGSAFPAPIVWEVRKNERLFVDGVVTVVDLLNFPGYKDKSYTAKLQAKFTDLIVLNKRELVDERQHDKVLDDVIEINPDTARVYSTAGVVHSDVLFGLDSTLFATTTAATTEHHCDPSCTHTHHKHGHAHAAHMESELDLIHIRLDDNRLLDRSRLENLLTSLPPEDVIRVKGPFKTTEGTLLLNCVCGRFTIDPLTVPTTGSALVFMGSLGPGVRQRIRDALGVGETEFEYVPRK